MLLSYKPLHLEAQQRLQEEGCVVDISGPAGASLALAAQGRRDWRNATVVECQSNGQGWHNRLLTKRTPSSIFFYI